VTTASSQLRRFQHIATALDARWRIPGTSIRFGWDAVIGLLPGLGDAIAGAVGSYGLYAGWRLGAPPVILGRMLLNLALETLIGTIPILGDLFDLGFKGNLRNLRLLERWLERPTAARRASRWLFAGIATGILVMLLLALMLLLQLFHLLFRSSA
jgi:Domain of unknown function (DUF4112)